MPGARGDLWRQVHWQWKTAAVLVASSTVIQVWCSGSLQHLVLLPQATMVILLAHPHPGNVIGLRPDRDRRDICAASRLISIGTCMASVGSKRRLPHRSAQRTPSKAIRNSPRRCAPLPGVFGRTPSPNAHGPGPSRPTYRGRLASSRQRRPSSGAARRTTVGGSDGAWSTDPAKRPTDLAPH